jgi:hypothetical protein
MMMVAVGSDDDDDIGGVWKQGTMTCRKKGETRHLGSFVSKDQNNKYNLLSIHQ